MRKRTKTTNRIKAEKSSGNIFADLGLPHPERELLKAKLTLEIYRLIRKRNLTQAEAGKILGIKQPHVSALMRNRAGSFSVERLMDFLTALGQDVEIRTGLINPADRSLPVRFRTLLGRHWTPLKPWARWR